jgi:hypothetical protein
MKVITVQDGNKFRLTLVPESPVDEFMMQAFRRADGSSMKVIPVDTGEIEKLINPYRMTNGKDESRPAVMIEMEISQFPHLCEVVPAEGAKSST